MVIIQSASIYSTGGSVAHQIDYSDGTSLRVIESRSHWLQTEQKKKNGWVRVGRAYKVQADKRRSAERVQKTAQKFLSEGGQS